MGLPSTGSKAKKRDQIIAIDIGGRSTKAIYLQRRGDSFVLLNYAVLDTPSQDKSPTVEQLTELLTKVNQALGPTRTKQVTIALGGPDMVFKQVELPQVPAEDLRQMMRYNSKSYLQQDLPDYVFDCFFLPLRELPNLPEAGKGPAGSGKHKAAVGGVKKELLDILQAAVRAAGWIPDQVIPGVVGPINAFEMAEPEIFRNEVAGLVDIGFKNTTISILHAGELALNRVVAIGGDKLTGGLAESMGISYEEAEGIKVCMAAEVQAGLESLINPLGRELRASLDFFEHQYDKPVGQVFLSGASARNECLVQSLQTELLVPCKTWNATRFLQMGLPADKLGSVEDIAGQLTTAVGAAVTAF